MFTRRILRAMLAAFAISALFTAGGGQQIDPETHGPRPAEAVAEGIQPDAAEFAELESTEMDTTELEVELVSFTKCGIKPKLSSAFAAFGCGYVIGEQLSRRWVDPWVQRCWPRCRLW